MSPSLLAALAMVSAPWHDQRPTTPPPPPPAPSTPSLLATLAVMSALPWYKRLTTPPPLPPAPPIPSNITLRKAAAGRGVFVGAAGNNGHIKDDQPYATLLGREYSLVTAENACKWLAIQPQRGRFDFAACDVISDFAWAHNMSFRGHNLCWGEYNPAWLEHGGFNATTKRSLLRDHTATVASHYGRGAYAWDVVNEALSDLQWRKQPVLKQNVWYPSVPDYVEVALRATRAAAPPSVKLFYNDYNIASATTSNGDTASHELHPRTRQSLAMGSRAKSQAAYDLLKDLKVRGVPIDGIGLQLHVRHSFSAFDGVAQNMARLAALGLEVHVTELDVTCGDGCDLQQQARVYAELLRVCLAQPACRNFETWGLTDKYTWKGPSQRPLPFDASMRPKPAFAAMIDVLLARM